MRLKILMQKKLHETAVPTVNTNIPKSNIFRCWTNEYQSHNRQHSKDSVIV